jgi:hypothetical protein
LGNGISGLPSAIARAGGAESYYNIMSVQRLGMQAWNATPTPTNSISGYSGYFPVNNGQIDFAGAAYWKWTEMPQDLIAKGPCPPGVRCRDGEFAGLVDPHERSKDAWGKAWKVYGDGVRDGFVSIATAEVGGVLGSQFIGWLAGRLAPPTIRFYSNVQMVLGKDYKSVSAVTTSVKNTGLLKTLGDTSGKWVKVYEAGILNGERVEVHYFQQKVTGEVFDVKVKYGYWYQKAFKNLIGN